MRLQRGVYRCFAPPHEAGTVNLSITWGNGSPCSNTQPFTYRVTPQTARTQVLIFPLLSYLFFVSCWDSLPSCLVPGRP